MFIAGRMHQTPKAPEITGGIPNDTQTEGRMSYLSESRLDRFNRKHR